MNEYQKRMRKKYPLAAVITDVYDRLDDFAQNPRWPAVHCPDPKTVAGKVKDYFGSEAFLGTSVWMWKEMRKK